LSGDNLIQPFYDPLSETQSISRRKPKQARILSLQIRMVLARESVHLYARIRLTNTRYFWRRQTKNPKKIHRRAISDLGKKQLFSANLKLACSSPDNGHQYRQIGFCAFVFRFPPDSRLKPFRNSNRNRTLANCKVVQWKPSTASGADS
jgi:hypothetical protein